jgi:hypothetical protein
MRLVFSEMSFLATVLYIIIEHHFRMFIFCLKFILLSVLIFAVYPLPRCFIWMFYQYYQLKRQHGHWDLSFNYR